ncbi:hypothetical protein AX16_003605 [Volvariella volvacea WC 439]|nr:hypothetical protein AX16_003605 [Volvariella volvacea WC 439]
MSTPSGISVSQDLASHFAAAIDSQSVRFLKIVIQNESLVYDRTININSTFEDDLALLQDEEILQDNTPAYVLARLDPPSSEWLAIYYVPDTAKVRDKMLYAATRASLLKSLGSTLFTDSLFATNKSDLTAEAYTAHKKHITAPQPLSAREKEMADVRAAEGLGNYEGSRARANHIGTGVGLNWSEDVENAIRDLAQGLDSSVVVIKIDPSTETLILDSVSELNVDQLHTYVPHSDPSYVFFAWPHNYGVSPQREIVFIYSCPTESPVKNRMLYSSGSSSVFQTAKSLFSESTHRSRLASRKVETSDPNELTEACLRAELGLVDENTSAVGTDAREEKKGFARPKGPARRRQA